MANDVNIIGNSTSGFHDVELKEYYERALMKGLRNELVLYSLAKKDTLPKNVGDTYSTRMIKDLDLPKNSSGAFVELGELTKPEPSKLTIVQFKVTLAQYGGYLQLSSKVDDYAIDPIMSESSELLGRQAGEVFEKKCMDCLVSGSKVFYAQGVASRALVQSGSKTITVKDLLAIKAYFKKANVKTVGGAYIAIISPEVELDLQALTTANASWIDVAKYADPKKAFEGEIGNFLGFRWIVSNSVRTITDTAQTPTYKNIHQCIFMGAEAFGVVNLEGESNAPAIIYKPAGSAGTNDPLDQIATLGWKNKGFATRIIREEALVRFETKVSSGDDNIDTTFTDSNRSGYDDSVTGNTFTA